MQEAFEVARALAFGDIKDAVVAQIAEGGGEATTFVQSVLVDTLELGAGGSLDQLCSFDSLFPIFDGVQNNAALKQ